MGWGVIIYIQNIFGFFQQSVLLFFSPPDFINNSYNSAYLHQTDTLSPLFHHSVVIYFFV